MVNDMVLRRADYSLSDEQQALLDSFATLLDRQCPTDVVRAAEPEGFDEKLWRQLVETRAVAMGVPEALGGDGAGLAELVLVAEEHGKHLAPVPFVESVVAARLIAAAGAAPAWLAGALDGSRLLTFAPRPTVAGAPVLTPAGSVADAVVGLDGDTLVLAHAPSPPRHVPNHGYAPLARWSLSGPDVSTVVLATGTEAKRLYREASREWRLLMAAALVGMGEASLRIGVEFAKEREAFGLPIGFFQAVSHPLVDVSIAVTSLRRLLWRTAWLADHEPGTRPELVPMVYAQAVKTAMEAAKVAVHTLGGVGFTVESDAQLYFRRVKGWTLVAGDPQGELQEIADIVFGPRA